MVPQTGYARTSNTLQGLYYYYRTISSDINMAKERKRFPRKTFSSNLWAVKNRIKAKDSVPVT